MKEISKQDLLRKAKFRGVLGAVILLGIGISGTVGVSSIDEDAVAIFRVLALLATLAIFYDCFVCLEKALGVRFVKTYRLIESIPIVAILCYCAMIVALKEGAMLGLALHPALRPFDVRSGDNLGHIKLPPSHT